MGIPTGFRFEPELVDSSVVLIMLEKVHWTDCGPPDFCYLTITSINGWPKFCLAITVPPNGL